MSQMTEGPLTLTNGETGTIEPWRVVKPNGTTARSVIYADAGEGDVAIGITMGRVATGLQVPIWPLNTRGTCKAKINETCDAWASLYCGDDGKLSAVPSGPVVAIAMEAAAADEQIIEVMPVMGAAAGGIAPDESRKVRYFEDFLAVSYGKDLALANESDPTGMFSATADRGQWLLTLTDGDSDAGEVLNSADDAPGGILACTTNDKANDLNSCQLNGESFKLASGKPLLFETQIAVEDADKMDWFIGLAIADTSILAGTSDRVGFECLHDGNIDCLVEQDTTENAEDTAVDISDGTVATWSTKSVKLSFRWDGVDTIDFFVDDALVESMTDNGTTIVIPDDEALTPTFEVKTTEAAANTLWIDYILVEATR